MSSSPPIPTEVNVESRKRAAQDSPQTSPQSSPVRAARKFKRKRGNEGEEDEVGSGDEWDQLQQMLADVSTGRADRHLDGWAEKWDDLCDKLEKRDKRNETEAKIMKELGVSLKRCAFLEHKLGIRR